MSGISIDTGVGEVADLVKTAVDKIWPDKSEQEKAELALVVTQVQGQLDANKIEAASPDLFKSGWRPGTGWVCLGACAWNWVGLSVAKFAWNILQALHYIPAGVKLDVQPADITQMLPILVSLLGLAAYRTGEKMKGVA